MDDRETLEFLRHLIHRHSGIHLGGKEQNLLESRVARRVRELGLPSLRAYRGLLLGPSGSGEVATLLDAVTVNYTFFFRETAQFHALAATVFPKLLAGRGDGEVLRIWSAGCSSGEEPYSIAITLAEVVGSPERCAAQILATDINRKVLRTGADGIYPTSRFTHLPQEYRVKYLVRDRETPVGSLRICEDLRRLVAFRRFNILRDAPPLRNRLDLIFCRNVMMYFDEPTKVRLVTKFLRYLAPGGFVIIGETEALEGGPPGFEKVGPAVYRKTVLESHSARGRPGT
jgi:chemotaxis protein methyltransferase CheR